MSTLRVSLLEQCQLRCGYCLPGAVTRPSEKRAWLTPDEHARLAPRFYARGVRKVRFTGGEPLLRPDVEDVVAAWRRPGVPLALTTNGQHLGARKAALARAGLTRVSVHVDSLRPERYRALMGDADVEDVLLEAARARALFDEVKLNCVVQRGRNVDELADFLAWSRETGVEVRFIELMNTGSAAGYVAETFFSGAEIVDEVRRTHDVRALPRRHPSDPARLFETAGGVVFGVIASDTQPFCDACDRLRLSADGRVRGCLYEPGGVPLGPALRRGDEAALERALDDALAGKRSYHPLTQLSRRPFSMADVGG